MPHHLGRVEKFPSPSLPLDRRLLCAVADSRDEPEAAAAAHRAVVILRVASARRRRPEARVTATEPTRRGGVGGRGVVRVCDAGAS